MLLTFTLSENTDRGCYRKYNEQRAAYVADHLLRYILREQSSSRHSNTWQGQHRVNQPTMLMNLSAPILGQDRFSDETDETCTHPTNKWD